MFKNVLVGVDGRSGGRDAIALATRLLTPGGKLALVHVHGGAPPSPHTSIPAVAPTAHADSLELLKRERAEGAIDVEAELIPFVSSSPGRGLHTLAEQRSADLIVVGSCGRGLMGRVMLGDDTKGALNGASCAVAVAAKGYAETPLPIATVGVGFNGSPESESALKVAREVAQDQRSAIRALEVVTIPTYAFTGVAPPALGESIDIMLGEARERLAELQDVDGRAVYGLPGEELAAFGDDVDLLVVGSRSYGPVKRLVLGSTSNYLQRHARCSLLVLPRTAASAGGPEPGEPASETAGTSEATRAQDSSLPQTAGTAER